MYEFHYKYVGVKYSSGAKLLFTNTDSLIYEIGKSLFDFSNYRRDSRFYDPVNKTLIGKMKDEVRGKIIHEFVGLKSKMYSLITVDDGEIKRVKDVNKNVDSIRHKEYADVLFGRGLTRHNIKRIQSKLHRIGTGHVLIIDAIFVMMELVVWLIFIGIY